jgi:hypothetical protein
MKVSELLGKWPVVRQLRTGSNGTGTEAMSEQTRNLRPKTDGAQLRNLSVLIAQWDVGSWSTTRTAS